MNAPLYTVEILRLAAELADPVRLERIDGSAEQRSPTCGSIVAVDVEMDWNGAVRALSQRVQACAFGQASAALMERHAQGRTFDEVAAMVRELSEWLEGSRLEPPAWPGVAALSPARSRKSRHAAILLPFRALLAALEGGRL